MASKNPFIPISTAKKNCGELHKTVKIAEICQKSGKLGEKNAKLDPLNNTPEVLRYSNVPLIFRPFGTKKIGNHKLYIYLTIKRLADHSVSSEHMQEHVCYFLCTKLKTANTNPPLAGRQTIKLVG